MSLEGKTANHLQEIERLKNIGSKIRAERKGLGLSLETLAKKVGISKMTLQRVETGATSPSVILLADIAFHLKRPVESFIREGDARVVHLKRDLQDRLFDRDGKFRIIGPKGLISDRITLTYSELEKGTHIETHTNRGFEWTFLMGGSGVVEVGGRQYPFETGDALFFDAHFPHSIRVKRKVRYVGLFLRDG
jgi:transcriptional regulator with XRE-family HTH domain